MENVISDIEILTKTLYFEAGVCNIFEIILVGWVIRNRVEGSSWYGNTYPQVCLKNKQFSCWNGKTIKEIKAIKWNNNSKWRECKKIAEFILEAPKRSRPSFMEGVYLYYNPLLVCPSWAKKKKMVYPGMKPQHIFLKNK